MERHLTKRQEWREIVNDKQNQLNQQLDELSIGLEYWNLLLKEASESGNDEEINRVAYEAIGALNNEWAFHGHIMLVTGKWHAPKDTVNWNGVHVDHEYEEAFEVGISNGFHVSLTDKDSKSTPTLGLSFAVHPINLNSNRLKGPLQALAFAEPHEVNLTYIRQAGPEVVSSDMVEIQKALVDADSVLSLYIDNENSSFYRQSAKKQRKFFDSLVELINDTLPDRNAFDSLNVTDLETSIIYVPKNVNQLFRITTNKLEESLVISGEVVGVTILESVAIDEKTRIESKDHMIDSSAGICLIIKPSEINMPIDAIQANVDILVPSRTIEKVSSFDLV